MRCGHLFNGIGGFQLAAAWMGWENIMSCEIDEFCNKVTKHHFPNCIQHGDIKTTDFSIYRGKIDIITGGFPCQPFSTAGKRKGTEDNRHLWPEMRRAIREIQPRWVLGENVPGLINWSKGLVFEQVQADLEAEGFEIFPPCILPACAVNAPHKRDRIWIIAYTINDRGVRSAGENDSAQNKEWLQERNEMEQPDIAAGSRKFSSDPERSGIKTRNEQSGREARADIDRSREGANVADTDKFDGHAGRSCAGEISQQQTPEIFRGDDANSDDGRFPKRHAESIQGEAQSTIERHDSISCWKNFPTQSPLCGRNDGISNRVDRIKSLGNAIVPQVAYEIFKTIEQYEQIITEADAVAY